MAENGNPGPDMQHSQLAMQCTVQQMGNDMVIVIGFACGALSAGLMMPPPAVRMMARQLMEAADKADDSIVIPAGPVPVQPPDA
jgi:hypothetical protein